MQAYIPAATKSGRRQQWVIVSVDGNRRCTAYEVFDDAEECRAEAARLNMLALLGQQDNAKSLVSTTA